MIAPGRLPWPFDDPKNVAVFTTSDVIRDRECIVLVLHDDDDGAWQFYGARGFSLERAMLVGLREVFELDPTIGELADLPCGWRASRTGPGSAWARERNPASEPGMEGDGPGA